ncbi:hypothetical protein Tco_0680367 [Tanacetum coccineum]|uniref:Uncharacterized protein n=1 Tax=Tanacetum coccineum TaxID=301880 RepID=A0ABQ4XKC5_9ASTR
MCPPKKRYDLMDANKKVELEHVQCTSESKILMNIIKNHSLRFNIVASASVPWIYMAQFWHTLKEDGSKNRLKFLLDRKELTLTLDDSEQSFFLQAIDYQSLLALADVMQDILQVLDYTCYGMGPTAIADNANDVLDPMLITIFKMDDTYEEYLQLEETRQATPSDPRQSAQLTPPVLVSSTENADEIILQDTIHVSLTEHKSSEEQEARENMALVYEHLAAEENEKLVEDPENDDDSSPPRHDDTSIPGTRLESRSDKESPEVEIV